MKIRTRIQTLWKARKWKIVAGLFLAAALSVYIAWPVSHERKIKNKIIQYHKESGQPVEISALSYRLVSENYPDSLEKISIAPKFNNYMKLHSMYSELAISALASVRVDKALGGAYSDTKISMELYAKDTMLRDQYLDSLNRIISIDSIINVRMKSRKPLYNLTRCDYIVQIGGMEKRADTLTLVLNDSLRIVWPKK